MKQTVRIIGGQFRGKKLQFPAIDGLRPTPDRVRETLFNWLMHDIRHALCLDAFAGSGALGFEAFSRGAKKVTLLENEPTAHANLLKLVQAFNAPELTVKKTDAIDFLQQTTEQFNLIFLDPPFAEDYLPACLEILAKSKVLNEGGLVYVESPHELSTDPTLWQQLKSKTAGQVVYSLYKKI